MVFEVGYQDRHDEFRNALHEYLRENSEMEKPAMIGLEFDLDPGEMLSRLEDTSWRRNGSMGQKRLPVRPWDLEAVEDEKVRELTPDDDSDLREDLEWRAAKYVDDVSGMGREELWGELLEQDPEMAARIQKKHYSEIQDYIGGIADRLFHALSATRDHGDEFLNSMEEQMTPQLEDYDGEPEDIVKVVENADQRANSHLADTMSVTWMHVLDQELYRAGWMFDGKQLFTMYTPRDDGFLDFHQYVV